MIIVQWVRFSVAFTCLLHSLIDYVIPKPNFFPVPDPTTPVNQKVPKYGIMKTAHSAPVGKEGPITFLSP